MVLQETKPLKQNAVIRKVVQPIVKREILPDRYIHTYTMPAVIRKEMIQHIAGLANNSNIQEKEQKKENQ